MCLPQEAWAFGNNIEKEPRKIEEICILFISREHLPCLQSNPIKRFFQNSINFVEQGLAFSHFESSIIP